jgi:hypothetical protein
VDDDLVAPGVGRCHHRRQRVVVGPDELGGVDSLLGPFAQDHRDGLADEPDDPVGEEGASHGGVEHRRSRRERLQVDVLGGEDSDHARSGPSLCHVEGEEASVGARRAHVGGVDGAVQLRQAEVRDVGAAVGQQLRVLDPRHAVAEDAHPVPHLPFT